jgi:hypothetical protein
MDNKPRTDTRTAFKPVTKKRPSSDEIAKKAYQIFERRGGTQGNDFDDWLQAEKELMEGK